MVPASPRASPRACPRVVARGYAAVVATEDVALWLDLGVWLDAETEACTEVPRSSVFVSCS